MGSAEPSHNACTVHEVILRVRAASEDAKIELFPLAVSTCRHDRYPCTANARPHEGRALTDSAVRGPTVAAFPSATPGHQSPEAHQFHHHR